MMSLLTSFMMLFSLGLGTSLAFCSSSWILAWVGLEINSLAILPLIARSHHPRAIEAASKYFLTQAAASAALLFGSCLNASTTGTWMLQSLTDTNAVIIVTVALALKIGLAPMHMWVPQVYQGVDLITAMILATWQKIAPFALLLQLHPQYSWTLLLLAGLSVVLGALGGINQNQFRKIIAFSSITNMGWIVGITQFYPELALLALLTYFVMTFALFSIFYLIQATDMNRVAMAWSKAPLATALVPLILLSIAGLPPFTGFLPKWLILSELAEQGKGPMATVVALTALISLFFYLRLAIVIFMTIAPMHTMSKASWRVKPSKMLLPMVVSAVSTLMFLPVAPTLMTLMAEFLWSLP